MFKRLILFILLAPCFLGHAQTYQVEKGNSKYNAFAFIEAQKIYLKLVEDGYATTEILSKLGDTYYFNDDLKQAQKWYAKLFAQYEDRVTPEYFFRYAQSLKAVNKYEESDVYMAKFNTSIGFDARSKMLEEDSNYLQMIDFQSGRFEIANAKEINSSKADFGPAFYALNNQVVYATARESGSVPRERHTWNNQPFLQLYTADADENGVLGNPKPMSNLINTKYHESTPVFTNDGRTMYFTRNNYDNGVYLQDKTGTNKLKIFRSYKNKGKWSKPEQLPFNSDEYSVAHPALSPDGKKLYFSSDMPGSIGYDLENEFTRSDIWVVDILSDGAFGAPRNLKDINTPGRETFPFISKTNTLYFSSSGHQGLGGLDVFTSSISPSGSMGKVVNIGKPINTTYDDFGFIVNDDTQTGYFSSNRPGGAGDDDIYTFLQLEDLREECEVHVVGNVTDHKTGDPIKDATLVLFDMNNNKIDQQITGDNATYTFRLDCDQSYILRVVKEDYTSNEEVITTPTSSGLMRTSLEIEINRIPVADCDDIGPLLDIQHIYFDFDKFNIRTDAGYALLKIKAFMELYPQVSIEIRSHTDSRAPDQYNELLSEKRAQSTRDWLISKGIDASRLTAKGFGERRLLNTCANGVACSSDEHQLNRRSEFIVSGFGEFKDCD
ncbi:OmpA family protein [Nonlabens sp.]|uniref:OmpA family protein n=1 Tax=Nonlabens sp. TaxID=1888209 RepID=UPI001BCF0C7B|nr:OmpA family protein [Nonlabens sp.]